MKIDEQEFRSFLANIIKYMDTDMEQEPNLSWEFESKVRCQIKVYREMLETPKPSKWKQLTIPL